MWRWGSAWGSKLVQCLCHVSLLGTAAAHIDEIIQRYIIGRLSYSLKAHSRSIRCEERIESTYITFNIFSVPDGYILIAPGVSKMPFNGTLHHLHRSLAKDKGLVMVPHHSHQSKAWIMLWRWYRTWIRNSRYYWGCLERILYSGTSADSSHVIHSRTIWFIHYLSH